MDDLRIRKVSNGFHVQKCPSEFQAIERRGTVGPDSEMVFNSHAALAEFIRDHFAVKKEADQ